MSGVRLGKRYRFTDSLGCMSLMLECSYSGWTKNVRGGLYPIKLKNYVNQKRLL